MRRFILLLTVCALIENAFATSLSSTNTEKLLEQGQVQIELEQPTLALHYYQQAIKLAATPAQMRIAMFRIAKIQLWLGDYEEAEKDYRQLLAMPLEKQDYEIALAGLIASLAYQDRPIAATQLLPANPHYQVPPLLLAGMQSELWAGQAKRSRNLLIQNYNLFQQHRNDQGYVGRQLRMTERESYQQTAAHQLVPAVYYEKDSEDFAITRYRLSYDYRYREDMQTGFSVMKNRYVQPDYSHLNGSNYWLQQAWYPNDAMQWNFKLGQGEYLHWRPALWMAQYSYKSNDMLGVKLYGQREIVETLPAILNKIALETFGVNVTYNPIYRVQVQTNLFHRHFSDNNQQEGFFGQANYLISNQWGISSGLRLRGFQNSKPGSKNYFDPKNYFEDSVIFHAQHFFGDGYQVYVDLGVGQQHVNPGGTSPTQVIETGANLPFSRHVNVQAFVGYSNSNFTSATGYYRRYGGLNLQWFI